MFIEPLPPCRGIGTTGRLMVETGQMTVIRQMTYQPVGRRAATVETMTFDRLRELNDGGTQRADFHVLAVVDAGHGSVTVDFLRHPLQERSAVWIAPGAVHRWDDIAGVAGHVMLFVPTAPVTHATRELVASPDLVAHWCIPDADWPFVDTARDHLLLEASAPPGDISTELPEILLSALVARLRPPHAEARSINPVFQLFRSSVDAHFREHHDVGYYARTLGYSPAPSQERCSRSPAAARRRTSSIGSSWKPNGSSHTTASPRPPAPTRSASPTRPTSRCSSGRRQACARAHGMRRWPPSEGVYL